MTGQERTIDKIRKLLAVANSGATGNGVEHEQETAMRQALSLLAKHNLSMSDVDTTQEKEDRESLDITEEFPCPWRRVVAEAISKMFFCVFFKTQVPNKQKYKFTFVGLESNSTTAKEMTQYLLKSIYQESMRQQKETGLGVAFGTSFRNAAANRVYARCLALRAEAEKAQAAEASSSTALMLVSVYEQEEKANHGYIDKIMGVKLKTRKIGGELKSRAGIAAGDQFGKNVSLHNQLGTSQKAKDTLAIGMS